MSEPKLAVVIIGAGILGLTTALTIQDRIQSIEGAESCDVIIIAKEWPEAVPTAATAPSIDYASMWAGAHVRPIPADTPQLVREAAWLKHTVGVFEKQAKNEPWLGVSQTTGREFLETPSRAYQKQTPESFFEESGLKGYRRLPGAQLPDGVSLGFEYETYCINPPTYCTSLLRRFVMRQGQTQKHEFKDATEAYDLYPHACCVVNASGTGFWDPESFPTRGQTVLTNISDVNETVTRQNKDGTWNFVIPRMFGGGTVIGGNREPNNMSLEASSDVRKQNIEGIKCLNLTSTSPSGVDADVSGSIANFRVIKDIVGRRPTRNGGVRLEEQSVVGFDKIKPGEVKTWGEITSDLDIVVHAYGAGGRGFEMSWGIANEAADRVMKRLEEKRTGVKRSAPKRKR